MVLCAGVGGMMSLHSFPSCINRSHSAEGCTSGWAKIRMEKHDNLHKPYDDELCIYKRREKEGKKWSCHSHGNAKIMKTKMCIYMYIYVIMLSIYMYVCMQVCFVYIAKSDDDNAGIATRL